MDSKTKVRIFCNKCKEYFEQSPFSHLQGHVIYGCTTGNKSATTENFMKKTVEIHGKDRFFYPNLSYKNNKTPIRIICGNCGTDWLHSSPKDHLYHKFGGCPVCGPEARGKITALTLTQFIENARKVHGNLYKYDKSIYINLKTPIAIYCRACKIYFHQVPRDHIHSGAGCPTCAILNREGAYSYKSIARMSKEKQNQDCYLYILQITLKRKTFYKIGITINNINDRISAVKTDEKTKSGRELIIKLIHAEVLTLKDAHNKEQTILKNFKVYKLDPEILRLNFGGRQELFTKSPKKYLKT